MTLGLAAALAAVGADGSRAQTQPELPKVTGTWTMTSEEGDYIGAGGTYSFGPEGLGFNGSEGGQVNVGVIGGDRWTIRLAAPAGEQLEERRYAGARRFPAATEPLLDVSGDGRGCNETFGSFTVHDVEYGQRGFLQALHMSFEQRCEQPDRPVLRGEVDLESEAPPEPLVVRLELNGDGANISPVDGSLELTGSLDCSQPVQATVIATATEDGRELNSVGTGERRLRCSPEPTDWVVAARSFNGVSFTAGPVDLVLRAEAIDRWYTDYTGATVLADMETSATVAAKGKGPTPPTDRDGTPAAASATGLTGFVARDPALSLLLWFATLVAAVVATAWVTLSIERGGRV